MKNEILNVLKPFLGFASSYLPRNAHNMFVLIIDPHFKNLQLIGNFVGFDTTTHIATIYDCEGLMLVLMIIYNKLTLIVVVVVEHRLLLFHLDWGSLGVEFHLKKL
jgi:hypothetical protein